MITVFYHNSEKGTTENKGDFPNPVAAVAHFERFLNDDVAGFYLLDRGECAGVPSIWQPGERAAIGWYGWQGYQPSSWYTYQEAGLPAAVNHEPTKSIF